MFVGFPRRGRRVAQLPTTAARRQGISRSRERSHEMFNLFERQPQSIRSQEEEDRILQAVIIFFSDN